MIDLFQRSIVLYIKNFWKIIPIPVVTILLIYALSYLVENSLPLFLVSIPLSFLLSLSFSLGILLTTQKLHKKKEIENLDNQFYDIKKNIIPFFFTTLWSMFYLLWIPVVIGLVFALLAATEVLDPKIPMLIGIAVAFVVLISRLPVSYMILPLSIDKNIHGKKALEKAKEFSKGTLGTIIAAFIILLVLNIAIALPVGIGTAMIPQEHIKNIIEVTMEIITASFAYVFLYEFYEYLKK